MYKERIHEEIMCIEHSIEFAKKMLRNTGRDYYRSYIKHQQEILQAFRNLEPKAEPIVYAGQFTVFRKFAQKRGFRSRW